MRGVREVCLAALVVMMMVSWYAVNLDSELGAVGESRFRRSVSAAQRRAWSASAGQLAASDSGGGSAGSGAPAAGALVGAAPALGADGCPLGRRPYHVLMTAASGKYQEWQSRIAYYHYLKQKRLNPCSEMGGFTRLVNLPGGRPDRLVDEMPSVVVKQLSGGRGDGGDYGFIVMNRPWGVMQLLKTAHWAKIVEEYVLIMETDHLFMHPPLNKATPTSPSAFKFYYMNSKDPKFIPVIRKYWTGSLDDVDPVGPSPAIMTKTMLEKLTPAWWDFSLRMKRDDPDANREFGWVLEMWGYTLGALSLGIRHVVDPDFQCEPQGTGMDGMSLYPIYHYTFDVRTERVWSISKRTFHGRYFPKNHRLPPPCSSESHFTLTTLFNEASANLPHWEGDDAHGDETPWPPPAHHWRHDHSAPAAAGAPWPPPVAQPLASPAAFTHAVVGTGPWRFGDKVMFFLARGVVTSQKGPLGAVKGGTASSGRWRFLSDADAATGGGDGSAASAAPLIVATCGGTFELTFQLDGSRWQFRAKPVGDGGGDGGEARVGSLDAPPPKGAHRAESAQLAPGSLAAIIAGAGPFAWAGMTPAAFLREGRFQTPWGVGTWGPKRGVPNVVEATFFGIEHELTLGSAECGRLLSVRRKDGDRVPVAFTHESPCE
ncbi:hypothetical protein KFE25_004666 [Diacronema lutheri]|uniref:Hydroxyproline O-arabinosyltransferase-like domain-containing protein n=3 Tax=Diacronema lutheri TaxID=2081491 RepID=A0A8J5XGS7_DIALT|nr:hypothetical protein KFE25_004666 [Diacronema lutheri]